MDRSECEALGLATLGELPAWMDTAIGPHLPAWMTGRLDPADTAYARAALPVDRGMRVAALLAACRQALGTDEA